jgi:serine phosphatase RsbU (regulator of sigma subunit)
MDVVGRWVTLKQSLKGDEGEVKDGMDIALCVVDTHFNEVYFSGANRPLFVTDKDGKIIELLPNRNAIGGELKEAAKKFDTKRFSFIPGQRMYLTSDGYVSQFGGKNNKKFMKSLFITTLEELQHQPIEQQKDTLQKLLTEWTGSNEQVDDVLIVGIEL